MNQFAFKAKFGDAKVRSMILFWPCGLIWVKSFEFRQIKSEFSTISARCLPFMFSDGSYQRGLQELKSPSMIALSSLKMF
jgi:hypothetical protein